VANNLDGTPDHPDAVIMVSNSITTPLTVSWSGDPALDYPKSVTIPPTGMVELKSVATRIRLSDDERRSLQTRLVADRYSEPVLITATGPKGKLSIEPSSRGGQLAVVEGHPLNVEGVIRNASASNHNVELILFNPRDSKSRTVSQGINVKEYSVVPFSIVWESMNPPPKVLKLRVKEGDKEIASCAWNVVSGKFQSTNKEWVGSTSITVNDIPEVPDVRLATSSECENLVILNPPRFEEGWFGRKLVLCWQYYGSNPGFVVREHVGRSTLTNRTGEEESPWRKLDSLSKRITMDSGGKWEVVLPLPMPGIHQYMVTTISPGEKLVASQSIQISWKMFLWPYLRILLLIAVALIVIRAIRERI